MSFTFTFLRIEVSKSPSLCLYRVTFLGLSILLVHGHNFRGVGLHAKVLQLLQCKFISHHFYWLEVPAGLDGWWIPAEIHFLVTKCICEIRGNPNRFVGIFFLLKKKKLVSAEWIGEGISGSSRQIFLFPGSLFSSDTSKICLGFFFPWCYQSEIQWH